MTINEAVGEAVKTMTTETTVEPTVVEKTEVVEKQAEVKAEKVETSSDVLEVPESQEQIQQALNIFRTLNNPQTAANFISELAKTAGMEIKGTEVKPKQAAQTIIEVLRESLGEENEDLAQKLAPALEKLISNEVKKPIEQLTYEEQARQVKVEVDQTWEKLAKELPDFTKLQNEMVTVMQDVQPGPKTSMEDYLRKVYRLAGGDVPKEKVSSEKTSKVSPAKVVEKLVKNAKETKQNVSGDVDESRVTKQSHRPSIREAVLAAAQTLNEKG